MSECTHWGKNFQKRVCSQGIVCSFRNSCFFFGIQYSLDQIKHTSFKYSKTRQQGSAPCRGRTPQLSICCSFGQCSRLWFPPHPPPSAVLSNKSAQMSAWPLLSSFDRHPVAKDMSRGLYHIESSRNMHSVYVICIKIYTHLLRSFPILQHASAAIMCRWLVVGMLPPLDLCHSIM